MKEKEEDVKILHGGGLEVRTRGGEEKAIELERGRSAKNWNVRKRKW